MGVLGHRPPSPVVGRVQHRWPSIPSAGCWPWCALLHSCPHPGPSPGRLRSGRGRGAAGSFHRHFLRTRVTAARTKPKAFPLAESGVGSVPPTAEGSGKARDGDTDRVRAELGSISQPATRPLLCRGPYTNTPSSRVTCVKGTAHSGHAQLGWRPAQGRGASAKPGPSPAQHREAKLATSPWGEMKAGRDWEGREALCGRRRPAQATPGLLCISRVCFIPHIKVPLPSSPMGFRGKMSCHSFPSRLIRELPVRAASPRANGRPLPVPSRLLLGAERLPRERAQPAVDGVLHAPSAH